MSRELSVEEIEKIRARHDLDFEHSRTSRANNLEIHALCDLALRAKAAEHRAGELALKPTEIDMLKDDLASLEQELKDEYYAEPGSHESCYRLECRIKVIKTAIAPYQNSTPTLGEGGSERPRPILYRSLGSHRILCYFLCNGRA